MHGTKFSKILVEEIIYKRFDVNEIYREWESIGLDRFNLEDKDEIWKWFVRSTLHWGGVLDKLIYDNCKSLLKNSILVDRENLLASITQMVNLKCFVNFTHNCPIEFKRNHFFNTRKCFRSANFRDCPMPKITQDLSWHRHHYNTSKIFLESAKRLFISNNAGKKSGNLNDVVSDVFEKHRNSGPHWRSNATLEFFGIFVDMKHYPNKAKTLLMLLSDLSMPFMHVNHWPDFDHSELILVDTHVQRLSHRFGFVKSKTSSVNQIKRALIQEYPESPRTINFAMFDLAGRMEICTKDPKCKICRMEIPKVYDACPYPDKMFKMTK